MACPILEMLGGDVDKQSALTCGAVTIFLVNLSSTAKQPTSFPSPYS